MSNAESSNLPYYSWAAHVVIALVCLSFVVASYCSYKRRRLAMQEAKLHRLMKSRKFQRELNSAIAPNGPRRVWSERTKDYDVDHNDDTHLGAHHYPPHSMNPQRSTQQKGQHHALMFSRFHGRGRVSDFEKESSSAY